MAGVTVRNAEKRRRADLNRLPVWTVAQASQWSGIKYRALMRLIRAGVVPVIEHAPARPTTSSRRAYMISRVRFVAWLEGAGETAVLPPSGKTQAA